MLKRILTTGIALAAVAAIAGPAAAQAFDARRLGMGGIVVSEVSGSATQNVAYRAVPKPGKSFAGYNAIPLPLGIIQYFADPPEFDPDNPNFNVFQIANLLGQSPWTLQLIEPEELSSDIIIDISKNSLAVDLGELQRLFPDESIRYGVSWQSPNLEFGTSNVFAGVRPQTDGRMSLDLDPALQQVLGEAAPVQPNSVYGATDEVQAQTAIAFTAGAALPLVTAPDAPEGDPRRGGFAVYAGARLKYLSGIAFWRADAAGNFATGDTIFGTTTPIDAAYQADIRDASDPKFGAGSGVGGDFGIAVFIDKIEIGVGVTDLGSTMTWKDTDLKRIAYDSVSGNTTTEELEQGVEYKSKFPVTGSLNVAYRTGAMLIGGTLDRTSNERWIPRAGFETWAAAVPLRGGVYLDTYKQLQFTAGSGIKLGSIGLDIALATNSRGITTDRGLELAASLALYGPGGSE